MRTFAALTVFILCTTTAALADKPRDTIAAHIAKAAPGSKKIKTFTGKLEDPKVGIFAIKKGRCYAVALRLGSGATIERAAVQMDWPNDRGQQQPVSFGSDMSDSAGAVFQPDCAHTSASVGVWVGLQSYDGIKPHGTGPYTIEVFERTAGKHELASQSAARAKAHKQSIKERDQHRAKECRECSSPESGRKVCVERRGLTMSDCGW